MMNVLIICNYQREIPPFMITMVKYAEKYYDKIEYINPVLYNDNSFEIISDKVAFRPISRKRSFRRLFCAFVGFFRREVRQDIKKAIYSKRFNKDFILHVASEIYPSELLYQEICKLLRTQYKHDNVTALAAWFNCNAYVVARLKRKFPSITAAAYAHAFEVNPERGGYIDLSLNKYKHNNLDRVTFISSKVFNSYKKLMGYQGEAFLGKIDICYLGTLNRDNCISMHGGDTLHLLSCSGVSELKRVDLILDVLESWSEYPIEWTHIGAGALYEQLSEKAQKISSINPYVNIRFLGKLDNRRVHMYYKENPVDVFINVSISEGLPVSIMEAISYGVPVIATDVGGTSEIVTPPYNGFLLSPDLSHTDIKNAIMKYIEMSTKQKEFMRKNSKQIWESKFNSDVTLNKYFYELSSLTEVKSEIK